MTRNAPHICLIRHIAALAGVRHLIWDMGYMLDLAQAELLGWAVIAGSVILTLLTVLIL